MRRGRRHDEVNGFDGPRSEDEFTSAGCSWHPPPPTHVHELAPLDKGAAEKRLAVEVEQVEALDDHLHGVLIRRLGCALPRRKRLKRLQRGVSGQSQETSDGWRDEN